MNNFKSLLLGTSLSLIPNIIYAQCAVTDCQQLGYITLQKCDNGLKCPFGEYWACPKVTKAELGSCNGYAKNCKFGDILNSDGTCTSNQVSGKIPLAIVIYVNSKGCGQAITASAIAKDIPWSTEMVITNAGTSSDWETAQSEYDSSYNTKKLIGRNNANEKYPAAWLAANYAPADAPETKGKWLLPAAGVIRKIFGNLDEYNQAVSRVGGETVWKNIIWSSTEANKEVAWAFYIGGFAAEQNGLSYSNKISMYEVRPVIEF